MNAELTDIEAFEQLDLWTRLLKEAEAQRDRFGRLAEGYSRVLEGLHLIHPELRAPIRATPPTSTQASPSASTAAATGLMHPVGPFKPTADAIHEVLNQSDIDILLTARDVEIEIEKRGWQLNSENPITVIRKALAKAVEDGWAAYQDIDGRTKGYRRKPATNGSEGTVSAVPSEIVPATRSEGGTGVEPPTPVLDQDHDSF